RRLLERPQAAGQDHGAIAREHLRGHDGDAQEAARLGRHGRLELLPGALLGEPAEHERRREDRDADEHERGGACARDPRRRRQVEAEIAVAMRPRRRWTVLGLHRMTHSASISASTFGALRRRMLYITGTKKSVVKV